MAFSSVLPFLLPTHSVACAVHLLLSHSRALVVNSAQCLIQDQIFTSPSPGAVDPRARTHERRVRMSAARSRSQRHCRLLIAPILLLNNKLAN